MLPISPDQLAYENDFQLLGDFMSLGEIVFEKTIVFEFKIYFTRIALAARAVRVLLVHLRSLFCSCLHSDRVERTRVASIRFMLFIGRVIDGA